MGRSRTSPLARSAAWAVVSGLLLLAGFGLLVGAILAVAAWRGGASPGAVQQQAWLALGATVLRQALAPLWALTLASWLVVIRVAPGADARWRSLLPGVAGLAVLWFVPVGLWRFDAWTPSDAGDVVGTALLCAGAVGAALLLPRWLWRPLAPGRLASSPRVGAGA